jgi:Na+-transporting NADH:ubiquinone oxidoreductase subunit NqrA
VAGSPPNLSKSEAVMLAKGAAMSALSNPELFTSSAVIMNAAIMGAIVFRKTETMTLPTNFPDASIAVIEVQKRRNLGFTWAVEPGWNFENLVDRHAPAWSPNGVW